MADGKLARKKHFNLIRGEWELQSTRGEGGGLVRKKRQSLDERRAALSKGRGQQTSCIKSWNLFLHLSAVATEKERTRKKQKEGMDKT